MKRLIVGLILVASLLMPLACAQAPSEEAPGPVPTPIPAPMSPGRGETSVPDALPTTEERMIVRTGDISLVVEDVVDARDKIAKMAVSFGGYVVSSQISGEEREMMGLYLYQSAR